MESVATENDAKFEFIQSLASDLSMGQIELPSFPDVVFKVRQALEDENCTTDRLVQLIGAEPVLAARLLSIANSAAMRPSVDPITDLNAAVNRVGRSIVRSSAMSFAMEQMRAARKLETVKHRLSALWQQCAHVAALSYIVAKRYSNLNADEAMFIGLMHGIGRMYILARAEDFPTVFGNETEFEAIMDEWDTGIGSSIVENWGFAPYVSEAVRDYKETKRAHDGDTDYTDVLVLAHLLFQFINAEGDSEFILDEVPAADRLKISAEEMISVVMESEEQIRSLKRALG